MKNVLVVAHRGFSGHYPENTLLAFRKAMEAGADMIELDVRQTKDGHLIVIHDATIDRTTDGTGAVAELTLKEIRRFSAGVRFSPTYRKEKVPLLEEVFDTVDRRTGFILELKVPGCEEKVVSLILRKKLLARVIGASFHQESVAKLREINPHLSTALITGSFSPEQLNFCLRQGIQSMNIHWRALNKLIVYNLHRRGLTVNAWTPDTRKQLQKT